MQGNEDVSLDGEWTQPNTTRRNNDFLMLAQRLQSWPNIKTPLFQRVVFAGFKTPPGVGESGVWWMTGGMTWTHHRQCSIVSP